MKNQTNTGRHPREVCLGVNFFEDVMNDEEVKKNPESIFEDVVYEDYTPKSSKLHPKKQGDILLGEVLPSTTLHARPQEGPDGEATISPEMKDDSSTGVYGDGELYNGKVFI